MPSFPMNVVVFQKLAEHDFLATMSLIYVNSSLRHFVLDEVVSVALLVRFLRQNKCSFLNDIYHRNFSNDDFTLLDQAFTALRRRMSDVDLYQNVKEYLAPLIWCSPRALLFNQDMRSAKTVWETLPADEKSRRLKMHAIYIDAEFHNCTSLLDNDEIETLVELYERVFSNLRVERPVPYVNFRGHQSVRISDSIFSGKSPHPLLCDVFFCGRYLNDWISANRKYDCFIDKKFRDFGYLIFSSEITPLLKALHGFEEQIKSTEYALVSYQGRRQALSHLLSKLFDHQLLGLGWGAGENGVPMEDEIYTALFNSPEWMENHNSSELGWWLAKYMQPSFYSIIPKSFGSKAEALVWIVLGAHTLPSFTICVESVRCCSTEWLFCKGLDAEHMDNLMVGVTSNEILLTVRTIIRHASEFSACICLGANICHHFVPHTRDEDMDDLISTFFKEAIQSSMVYTLLYGMAHAFRYGILGGLAKMPLVKTQRYLSQVRSRYLEAGEHESDRKRCDQARGHFGKLLDFLTRPI